MTLPTINRYHDPVALSQATAELISTRLAHAIGRRGHASLALAGGSTPRALHHELALRALDWRRVHIYFGDERCVPADDSASNYRMARESLLDHVPIEPVHVHRIEGEQDPGTAAERYSKVIGAAMPIDIVVLGMGEDGHTASIFPDTPAPREDALFIPTMSPVAPHHRVSMTLQAIRACSSVILLVSGPAKAARLAEIHGQQVTGRAQLPAARIGPALWMIDEAAASRLPR